MAHGARLLPLCTLLLLAACAAPPSADRAAGPVASHAAVAPHPAVTALSSELWTHVIPFWLDHAYDPAVPGYRLAEPGDPDRRLAVSQARLVWVFSTAAVHGPPHVRDRSRAAANHGFRFLVDHARDPAHGGYPWLTEPNGTPINPAIDLYTLDYVLFGLAAYIEATGDPAARDEALRLLALIETHLADDDGTLYAEFAEPDWTPIRDAAPTRTPPAIGARSANAHLHLLEAALELHRVIDDPLVERTLRRSLDATATHFYPANPAHAAEWIDAHHQRVDGDEGPAISLGHSVEAAWLIVEAQRALGLPRDMQRLRDYIDFALATGGPPTAYLADPRGEVIAPAAYWWVQNELIAAMSVALTDAQEPELAEAMHRWCAWYADRQLDPTNRVPYAALAADGSIVERRLRGEWKAGYHDVRMRLMIAR
ncbi:MAG: AGE family epimerase/isomerase [Planctomycetota bacterium]